MSDARRTIGVDVGGTFTDLFFVLDEATGTFAMSPRCRRPRANQAIGFMDGMSASA